MGMLTLGATQGSKIQIEVTGEDADKAVRAIEKLVDSRFNENE
jgi:phosphotransferase system HPr (HPr) family protein